MDECMAELLVKQPDVPKEGRINAFFAPDKNYWGGHGIVAGQTPLGLGLAYGLKYNGDTGAALCLWVMERSIKGHSMNHLTWLN